MNAPSSALIVVWDPFVRIFHWSVVTAFVVAYVVEPDDGNQAVHVWAGYVVAALVIARILWGFIGSEHARFRDFLFGPFTALGYFAGLFTGRARRYVGHSPAGAWMVYALLLGLLATVGFGMAQYALDEGKGPLAPLLTPATISTQQVSESTALIAARDAHDRDDDHDEKRADAHGEQDADERFEELHELAANFTLIMALLHIGGVVLASVVHRENLARAMVTGRKRA